MRVPPKAILRRCAADSFPSANRSAASSSSSVVRVAGEEEITAISTQHAATAATTTPARNRCAGALLSSPAMAMSICGKCTDVTLLVLLG
eukprot:814866-Rhodomonas_salina.1